MHWTLDRAINENNHPHARVTAHCFGTIVHCIGFDTRRVRGHGMGCTALCKNETPKRLGGSSTKRHTIMTGRAKRLNTCYVLAEWVLLSL